MVVAIAAGVVLVAVAVAIAAIAPAGAVISLLNDFHLLGQWSPYASLIAGPDLTIIPRPPQETPSWPPASS